MNNSSLLHGAGVAFQAQHYAAIMDDPQRLDFFEIQAEQYFSTDAVAHMQVFALRQLLPLTVHSIGLSLGSPKPLDGEHLQALVQLCRRYQPTLVSSRLGCAQHAANLLGSNRPLAFNASTLQRLIEHVDQVQTVLGRQLLIENPPAFVHLAESDMHEADFLRELCQHTACGLLLDIGNLLISSHNCGGNAENYLQRLPAQHIREIRLGGYSQLNLASGSYLLVDEHASVVADATWDLYADLLRHIGRRPAVVAWERQLPSWMVLAAEVDCARALQHFPFMPECCRDDLP